MSAAVAGLMRSMPQYSRVVETVVADGGASSRGQAANGDSAAARRRAGVVAPASTPEKLSRPCDVNPGHTLPAGHGWQLPGTPTSPGPQPVHAADEGSSGFGSSRRGGAQVTHALDPGLANEFRPQARQLGEN